MTSVDVGCTTLALDVAVAVGATVAVAEAGVEVEGRA
jgi:hypothetical protein